MITAYLQLLQVVEHSSTAECYEYIIYMFYNHHCSFQLWLSNWKVGARTAGGFYVLVYFAINSVVNSGVKCAIKIGWRGISRYRWMPGWKIAAAFKFVSSNQEITNFHQSPN